MSPRRIDITGLRSGRLVVLGYAHTDERSGRSYWHVRCDCGMEKVVLGDSLRTGGSRSCGCLRRENNSNLTHGMSNSPEYRCWQQIRQRCLNVQHPRYKDYGGRGITIHPQWVDDFALFLKDVGKRPTPTHSLDRLDNNGSYVPGNVRWATVKQQNGNRCRAASAC